MISPGRERRNPGFNFQNFWRQFLVFPKTLRARGGPAQCLGAQLRSHWWLLPKLPKLLRRRAPCCWRQQHTTATWAPRVRQVSCTRTAQGGEGGEGEVEGGGSRPPCLYCWAPAWGAWRKVSQIYIRHICCLSLCGFNPVSLCSCQEK